MLLPISELNNWVRKKHGISMRPVFETAQVSDNPPRFRSTVTLPDGRKFTSKTHFSKKKEAEHAASQAALDEAVLEASAKSEAIVNKEASPRTLWKEIVNRVEVAFMDQVILNFCPLKAHFRAAIQRSDPHGSLPLGVIASLDNRINSACKAFSSMTEWQPLPVERVALAAAIESSKVDVRDLPSGTWICRKEPFSDDLQRSLLESKTAIQEEPIMAEASIHIVRIPADPADEVEELMMDVKNGEYFLDKLAEVLGSGSAGNLKVSRVIEKSKGGIRCYSELPKPLPAAWRTAPVVETNSLKTMSSSSLSCSTSPCQLEQRHITDLDPKQGGYSRIQEWRTNDRASWLSGEDIRGDAVLAGVGSTWSSGGKLWCDDITLAKYYRLQLSRTPLGSYKLSTAAPLLSLLPRQFSSRKWHGKLPRALLQEFCNRSCLASPTVRLVTSTPVFEVHGAPRPGELAPGKSNSPSDNGQDDVILKDRPPEGSIDFPGSKDMGIPDNNEPFGGVAVDIMCGKNAAKVGPFTSRVVLRTSSGTKEFLSTRSFQSSSDAMHSAALATVHWLQTMCEARYCGNSSSTTVQADNKMCDFKGQEPLRKQARVSKGSLHSDDSNVDSFRSNSGLSRSVKPCLSPGAIVTIQYSIQLLRHSPAESMLPDTSEGPHTFPQLGSSPDSENAVAPALQPDETLGKPEGACVLERNASFEFEWGRGAVLSPVEELVGALQVGQTFSEEIDVPNEWVLQSMEQKCSNSRPGNNRKTTQLQLILCKGKMISFLEPLEEKMEFAFFTPPLSQQRIAFVLDVVCKSGVESVVDLGCGSGSLMVQLAEHGSLRRIFGVDISSKDLSRAAKGLRARLEAYRAVAAREGEVKLDLGQTVPLLDSVQLFQGTIVHPDMRLRGFDLATCIEVIEHLDPEPLLLVGDNVLGYLRPQYFLASTPNIEYNHVFNGDPATPVIENTPLRNHDHRFEWTRQEFKNWAEPLAEKHGYKLSFSGVGGPLEGLGFATQIALFEKVQEMEPSVREDQIIPDEFASTQYLRALWSWDKERGYCTQAEQV